MRKTHHTFYTLHCTVLRVYDTGVKREHPVFLVPVKHWWSRSFTYTGVIRQRMWCLQQLLQAHRTLHNTQFRDIENIEISNNQTVPLPVSPEAQAAIIQLEFWRRILPMPCSIHLLACWRHLCGVLCRMLQCDDGAGTLQSVIRWPLYTDIISGAWWPR